MLAFGLAVFGGMAAIIIVWLGRTAIVIDAKDAGIQIAVNGETALITVPGEQSIKVKPGEQELKVSYAGLETQTKRFSLKSGETKKVEVWIAGSRLVAHLENEISDLTPALDQKERASKGVGQPPDNKPQKPLAVAGLGKVAPTERRRRPATARRTIRRRGRQDRATTVGRASQVARRVHQLNRHEARAHSPGRVSDGLLAGTVGAVSLRNAAGKEGISHRRPIPAASGTHQPPLPSRGA